MRLSDLPLYTEIKDFYSDNRRGGKSREETVGELFSSYECEMNDNDDSCFFWIALASAQCAMKELTAETIARASSAIETVKSSFEIANTKNLNQLLEKLNSPEYSQPPKMHKAKQAHNMLGWNVGDVYMYPLRSDEARKAHLDDCCLLLVVVDQWKVSNEIYPIVYRLIWIGSEAPKSVEEINASGFLSEKRAYSRSKSQAVYRVCLMAKKKVDFKPLIEKCQYIGNFPDLRKPDDEADIPMHALRGIFPDALEPSVCYDFHNADIFYFL